MMIAMPVLTPCAHLQRPKPPDILAGVPIRVFAQMSKAVDEALHVQRIDKADSADPEKACPAKQCSAEYRYDNHGNFGACPKFIDAAGKFATILHFVCRLRLI